MLFKSLALLAVAATSQAKLLSLAIYNTGAADLSLGGSTVYGENGVRYKIDDGEWKDIDNEGDTAPCAYECGDEDSPAYIIPELNNNVVTLCTTGDTCVPGNSFQCTFHYGDLWVAYNSGTDKEFFGVGNSIESVCGGPAFEINL